MCVNNSCSDSDGYYKLYKKSKERALTALFNYIEGGLGYITFI